MPFPINTAERKLGDKPYRFNFLLGDFISICFYVEKCDLKKGSVTMSPNSLVGVQRGTRHGGAAGGWARLAVFPDIFWGWKGSATHCSLKGL